jgi:hypothetical protein
MASIQAEALLRRRVGIVKIGVKKGKNKLSPNSNITHSVNV